MAPAEGVRALARAPDNVVEEDVRGRAGVRRAWTNRFEVPVSYCVEVHADLLARDNPALALRWMPEGLRRRFVVVDATVWRIYGASVAAYFDAFDVELKVVVVEGEEKGKRFKAVGTVFDALCEFGLLRREPVVAIGGGCVLDIVGFVASVYRRGVPYVRVPTTLLGIVDASVGVKCGVDWEHPTLGGLKNRMGSFYAPLAALLDKSFVKSQDERNLVNGMGEIMKLALVRSEELFELLELHGRRVIEEKFQGDDGVADTIIEMSVQIMLEELGPNLWEHRLERCVDYGHTFSKILEFSAYPPLMHGEAVNIDGFFCVILAHRRGWIDTALRDRILVAMRAMRLPTWSHACTPKLMAKGVADGTEHRHGKLRMPLVKGAIGEYGFVNKCDAVEIQGAIDELAALHPDEISPDAAVPLG